MQILKEQLNEFCKSDLILDHEREVATRMLAYIDAEGPSAFVRTTRPAHFTASALVLSPDNSKILLMWHKKLNKWLQPGGHADGDFDLLNVATREVFEETGAEVSPFNSSIYGVDWHPIPANAKEDAHEHADCAYLLKSKSWELVVNEDEAGAVKWFEAKEALALIEDASTEKLIKRFATYA
jgi:8-oxo-dGTP pyrophosphatase MutT (NUDIX family)